MRVVKHKFHAKPTERDGFRFDSKLESRYYELLKVRMKADVLFFLRQVPFHLPGEVKYVADFLVFLQDGTVEVIDVKGKDTPISIAKRKMVEAIYPINIKIVTKV